MEKALERNMELFYNANAKIDVGGLHLGISDVASNVTLKKNDEEIKGNHPKLTGRLSRADYDQLSQTENRRSTQVDGTSGKGNKLIDVMSLDFGGQEVTVIHEKDIQQEENSMETQDDELVISGHRGSSPGRLLTTKGH